MTVEYEQFKQAFHLLNGRLALSKAPPYRIVVCGGAALLAVGLASRVTQDVDIVAMADENGFLLDPAPLPEPLVDAANEVQSDLGLPDNWLNNGPSSGKGGLFQMGLPSGFEERLSWKSFGENLSVGFIGRVDQIHFKLYAAVDSFGGTHVQDLHNLDPTDDELMAAASWSRTHDTSEGYHESLKKLFQGFGYEHLIERI